MNFENEMRERLTRLETKIDSINLPCKKHALELDSIKKQIYTWSGACSILAFIAARMFGG